MFRTLNVTLVGNDIDVPTNHSALNGFQHCVGTSNGKSTPSQTCITGNLTTLNQVSRNVSNLTHYDSHELLAWIIVIALLCFAGIITSILALIVTWPRRNGLAGVSVLVWHLVLVTLLNCIIVFPSNIIIIQLTQSGHRLPHFTCPFLASFNAVLQRLVNWSEVSLAVNRVVALFTPHSYQAWTTKKVNICLILSIWLISSSIALPISLGGLVRVGPLGQCTVALTIQKDAEYRDPFSIITYSPYAICGVGALSILWKVSFRSRMVSDGGVSRRRVTSRRMKMAVVLVIVFVWNTACNLIAVVIVRFLPGLLASSPVSSLWFLVLLALMNATTPVSDYLYLTRRYKCSVSRGTKNAQMSGR